MDTKSQASDRFIGLKNFKCTTLGSIIAKAKQKKLLMSYLNIFSGVLRKNTLSLSKIFKFSINYNLLAWILGLRVVESEFLFSLYKIIICGTVILP